ncbi:MAG TPA: hypothetical protein VH397_20125 [Xanthobacteraceae bacterium]|jgi:localization factor PodJL
MKSDLPWHIRGVRPEAIEAAREAARRRGVTAGEWLDAAILDSALRQGVAARPSAHPRYPCHEDANERMRSPCGPDMAGDRLRDDVAEIGLILQQALPRRTIEALESEVRRLTDRVDSTRHLGADTAARARVERGIAEMRDALRSLVPAESLLGIAQALQQLSHRIDRDGCPAQDPAALRRIEGVLIAVRGIATRVASSDALAKLSDEVRSLAGKIDEAASSIGGRILSALEGRLAGLADSFEIHSRNGRNGSSELEELVRALIDRIERGQCAHDGHSAFPRLEALIAKLAEKLDACDARLDHLEAIEHGVARLHLEYRRISKLACGPESPPTPEIDALVRDVADLRHAEHRTRDSLEAVHGTLGHVVDRLAMIETDMCGMTAQGNARVVPTAASSFLPAGAPISPSPAASEDAAMLVPEGATATGPETPPKPGARPASEHGSVDPGLPADHSPEPGSGAARGRNPGSRVDRIFNSETTPGPAKPCAITDCVTKSDFIAAARRAVRAAAQQVVEADRASTPPKAVSASANPAGRIGKLSALIGVATGILAVLGGLHIARTLRSSTDEPKLSALGERAAEVSPAPRASAAASTGPPASLAPAPSRGQSDDVRAAGKMTISAPGIVVPGPMPGRRQLVEAMTPPGAEESAEYRAAASVPRPSGASLP